MTNDKWLNIAMLMHHICLPILFTMIVIKVCNVFERKFIMVYQRTSCCAHHSCNILISKNSNAVWPTDRQTVVKNLLHFWNFASLEYAYTE